MLNRCLSLVYRLAVDMSEFTEIKDVFLGKFSGRQVGRGLSIELTDSNCSRMGLVPIGSSSVWGIVYLLIVCFESQEFLKGFQGGGGYFCTGRKQVLWEGAQYRLRDNHTPHWPYML